MIRTLLSTAVLLLSLASHPAAGERVPGKTWLRYASPEDAGWSAEGLAKAEEQFRKIPSAAFLVIEDGVVVVAWGDVERRFMCHSVRKSLLSGLIGAHVDAGAIDRNATLAQLGIDDQEPKLTEEEKTARVRDLLAARSGVYRLAAYEPPQNPKPPRGSHAPGTFWCYNNWDFNTLLTIFEQETRTKVFEEFDRVFGDPLGMQDFRVRDGYYHYELDKSAHPAYPFRLSARDMARFGLLFLRKGTWDEERILSDEWVAESTNSYSESWLGGYGYMWWTHSHPRLAELGTYSARGVGNQSIDVIPGMDLVVVNRTNTFVGEDVSNDELHELIVQVLDAKVSEAPDDVALVPLAPPPSPEPASLASEDLARLDGVRTVLRGTDAWFQIEAGEATLHLGFGMQFDVVPLSADTFLIEGAETRIRIDEDGEVLSEDLIVRTALDHLFAGRNDQALEGLERAVELFPESAESHRMLAYALNELGDVTLARGLAEYALELDPGSVSTLRLLASLEES